jgi:hypothetical protein
MKASMTKVSIICLIAGCLQFIVGVVLSAANIGMMMLGISIGASFGIGLVLSGLITLVVGLATGIYAWRSKQEGGALAAIINLSVTGFLLLLIGLGVVVQQVQGRKSAELMKKWQAEQADVRHQAAVDSYREYLQALWSHKVVLLSAGKISKAMGSVTVGGYQVITVPEVDQAIDPVNAILLGRTEPYLLKLVKELLTSGAQEDLLALQAFSRANGTSCRISLHGGYPDIMDEKFKLLEAKDEVIAAIDKEAKD